MDDERIDYLFISFFGLLGHTRFGQIESFREVMSFAPHDGALALLTMALALLNPVRSFCPFRFSKGGGEGHCILERDRCISDQSHALRGSS